MSVLGLDLSLTSTGVAVIYKRGTAVPDTEAVTSKGKATDTVADRSRRISTLVEEITAWIPPYCELVIVEGPSYGSAGSGTWDRAGLWHSVVARILAHDIPVAVAAPTTAKKWATGSGRAEKNTIGVHMGRLFPDVELASDDAVDALVMAHMAAFYLDYRVPTRPHHDKKLLAAVEWPPMARDTT